MPLLRRLLGKIGFVALPAREHGREVEVLREKIAEIIWVIAEITWITAEITWITAEIAS